MTWVDAGVFEAIPARGARVLVTGVGPIAVFHTSDGRLFALRDRCPHRGGPLSQGIVHGQCVTCPLHEWVIELPTGTARAPDEGAVETFAVRVERGRVLVDLGKASSVRVALVAQGA